MYKKIGMAALGAAAAYGASGRGRRSPELRRSIQQKYRHLKGQQPLVHYTYFDGRIVYLFGSDGKLLGWGKLMDKVSLPNHRQVLDGLGVIEGGLDFTPRVNMAKLRRKGRSAKGRRAAPTLKQRKAMGQKLQALPWEDASALYKRNHPRYKGIGGYPMNTKLRASGARSYGVAAYNSGKLTKKDVETIFRRTSRRYPSMPKFDGLVCKKTSKSAKRRKCSSRTSR